MNAYNPFVIPPLTLCDDFDIPALPECQDTMSYTQARSQIAGLLMLPIGATGPEDWTDAADWLAVVDNTDTTNTKAKYLVGRGSFLPLNQVEVSLSGGRLVENRERTYGLNFSVLNMNDAHTDFGRKLQNNARKFDFWLQTLDDRIIGGPNGMRPFFVNADFPFAEGNNDREVMQVSMQTAFLQFPAMTAVAVDLSSPGTSTPDGTTISELLDSLPEYVDNAAAIADGLNVGDWYITLPGNDTYQPRIITKVYAP